MISKMKLVVMFIAVLTLSNLAALADAWSDRITVTVRGEGPDVVLISGLACSGAVWDATAAQLEKNYRLHVVQINGFAGLPAQANAQGVILKPVVEAIDAYIKTNKLQSPRVIGHSLGGTTGMMLALQHPENIDGLMLVDSLPFSGALAGAKNVAEAKPRAAAMRDCMIAQTQDDYARSEKRMLPALVKSPQGLKIVTDWAVASDKSVVARAMFDAMTTDLRPKLARIKTPTTILYPWDSSTGFAQSATDAMYQKNFAALPNKTLARIDGSRHFIMLDQPELFIKQAIKFLKLEDRD